MDSYSQNDVEKQRTETSENSIHDQNFNYSCIELSMNQILNRLSYLQ